LYSAEASRRRELGYPPFAAVARIDVPADRAEAVAAEVAGTGVEVLGPLERDDRTVVVARMPRRDSLLAALKPVVQRWREAEEPMRVDVDPWEVFVPKWRS
jgi:primosomal protein N'